MSSCTRGVNAEYNMLSSGGSFQRFAYHRCTWSTGGFKTECAVDLLFFKRVIIDRRW